MMLSKNNKQINKQKTETEHDQEEQTWSSRGKRGGSGRNGHFGGLGAANCYTWNGWATDPTVEHMEMCVIAHIVVQENLMKHCKSTIL